MVAISSRWRFYRAWTNSSGNSARGLGHERLEQQYPTHFGNSTLSSVVSEVDPHYGNLVNLVTAARLSTPINDKGGGLATSVYASSRKGRDDIFRFLVPICIVGAFFTRNSVCL